VHDRADTSDRAVERIAIAQIAEHDLRAPLTQRLGPAGVAGEDADAFALLQQARNKTASDAPGRPGDQRGHAFGSGHASLQIDRITGAATNSLATIDAQAAIGCPRMG
jgi:hypothetical protein